jgi:fibronectin-binding autotransporter adhesin
MTARNSGNSNRSGTISLKTLSLTTSTLALLAIAVSPQSAHAQTYTGNDTTNGPFNSPGLAQFRDSSTLNAAAADTITDGTQMFYDTSMLDASAANAVNGGLQYFKGTSILTARAANSIHGGQQDFSGDSILKVNVSRAIGGGTQYFRERGSLNLNVANAIGGGTQTFFEYATLNIRAANALDNSNALIFSNQVGGGIGGFMYLNGIDTVVGRITSAANNSGWISNNAATAATLTIDSSLLGDSSFSGVITDGGAPLALVKRGSGTLTLSGSDGYSGGTTIEAGTLLLRGSGSLGAQTGSLTIHSGAVLDLGGASGRVGGLSGAGTITTTQPSSNGHLFSILDQPADMTFSGVIKDGIDSAAGDAAIRVGLRKAGAGTQTLSGVNTFTGGTIIESGTLRVTGNGTLGAATGSLNIGSGGTLIFDTTALKVGSLSGAGTITRSDFNPGMLTVDQSTNTNFSGAINDYFDEINGVTTMTGLTKAGTGTLTLSGNSAYTGATNVTGGTLLVDGSIGNVMWGPIQLGTSQVAVASGGSLGGAGLISGGVSVASGGTLIGRAGQTLSMGSLTLDGGSVVNVSLGAPGNTRLFDVTGNLTLAGTLNVADAGSFGNGLYRLFDYGGTLTNNGMAVGATPTGYAAGDLTVQTSVVNQINLLVGAVAPGSYSFWNGAQTTPNNMVNGGAGTWTAAGTNWTNAGGSASGVYDPAVMLIFAGAPGTVTVSAGGGALDVNGGMQFFVDGYTVAGDALNLTAAAMPIRVGDGSAAGRA